MRRPKSISLSTKRLSTTQLEERSRPWWFRSEPWMKLSPWNRQLAFVHFPWSPVRIRGCHIARAGKEWLKIIPWQNSCTTEHLCCISAIRQKHDGFCSAATNFRRFSALGKDTNILFVEQVCCAVYKFTCRYFLSKSGKTKIVPWLCLLSETSWRRCPK